MKYFLIISTFLFQFLAFSQNTITVNDSGVEKTENIDEVTVSDDGILINGVGSLKCFLPFEKLLKNTPNTAHCATCVEEYTEKDRFSDMFSNAKDAKIGCEVKDDVTIGFDFLGHTSYRGESAYVRYGRILDMKIYKTDFHKEEKPGIFDSTIYNVEKVLLKLLF